MNSNHEIRSYRDLRVWQKGMDVSVPANIAEGYGRNSKGEYVQFLRVAQGSLKELETHLILSVRVKLATSDIANPILEECESLGRMIRSLIRSIQASM